MRTYISLLALLPFTASASEFSYKNFSIGYGNGSAELPSLYLGAAQDLDIEGFQIDGQFEIANNFFGFISYQDGDISLDTVGSLDLTALTAGLGGYVALGENVDLQYSVGHRYSNWEASGFSDQSIGHINANIGIRWSPVEWLEFHPSITQFIPVNDDDLLEAAQGTYLDARLFVTAGETFQPYIGVTYNIQADSDNIFKDLVMYQVGMRFSF
jgi:hypothetical protein